MAIDLKNVNISLDEIPVNTDEEIEAVFTNLMEEYVAELTDCIDALDRLDPPLAPHVADQVKAMLFSAQKLTSIDIGRIAGNVRDRVNTEHLDQLLRSNADKVAIQNELAAVYYALSQSAASVLKGAFLARGVASDEHMALTYTLSRDNLTGVVTIVYSQPEGLKDRDNHPLNFHWTTTVAVDGTVTTTPLVIEPPPQGAPANP